MEHRRTPRKRALTIPGSVMVATLTLCLIAAGVLIAAVVSGPVLRAVTNDSPDAAASPSPTADESVTPTESPTAEGSPTASESPTGDEDASDESDESDEETQPQRDMPVTVFNNTGVSGSAAALAERVRGSGWQVTGVGNWQGQIPSTTVYYPSGKKHEAELLADDVDIDRVKPAVGQMPSDHMTIIISGAP